MDRLDEVFAWKQFLVGVVAVLITAGGVYWFAETRADNLASPAIFVGK